MFACLWPMCAVQWVRQGKPACSVFAWVQRMPGYIYRILIYTLVLSDAMTKRGGAAVLRAYLTRCTSCCCSMQQLHYPDVPSIILLYPRS
jgi:hypothetical protein